MPHHAAGKCGEGLGCLFVVLDGPPPDDQLARLRENGGICGAVLYGDFIAAGTIRLS